MYLVDREDDTYVPGQLREVLFQKVCNGNIKGIGKPKTIDNEHSRSYRHPKCHLVHHWNPFLIIGPFHIEVKFYEPFRTIIHEFFTEKEMDWIMGYSGPRLTKSREQKISQAALQIKKSKLGYKSGVTEGCQFWFNDIEYPDKEKYTQISNEGQPLEYEVSPAVKDPYKYIVNHKMLYTISKRIELVTHFNVTARHAATPYRTTNYGLSGIFSPHLDTWGYEKGAQITEDRKELIRTGDYMATFQGYYKDTPGGGATGFMNKNYEGTVGPKKGSAAFWINMFSCHEKEQRSIHAGCPVLKGSKWIISRWMFSWDQWKSWPCYLEPMTTILPFSGMST